MHGFNCLILGASLNVSGEKLPRDLSNTRVKCSIKRYSAHEISINCLQHRLDTTVWFISYLGIMIMS